MKQIEEIIGNEEASSLREEFESMIDGSSSSPMDLYDNVEDLLMGYGLEMDYLEQLLF